MNTRSQFTRGVCLLGMLMLVGCDSGPETVPVYGTVSFEGRAEFPNTCRIYFRPTVVTDGSGISRPVVATAKPDGSYETQAFRDSKGLLPGTYQVEVSYFYVKPGMTPDRESNFQEFAHDHGELVVESGSRGMEYDIPVPKEN